LVASCSKDREPSQAKTIFSIAQLEGFRFQVSGTRLQVCLERNNHRPETLNLKLETWNLVPETWNLKPEILFALEYRRSFLQERARTFAHVRSGKQFSK
jgi:hypothetical protein